jgi:hypothetical protein
VHELMQVQEAEHLARRPEGDALGQPDEPHPLARAPFGRVWHDLPEREERLGHLEHDLAGVEVGPGGQVRLLAVAERPDDQAVADG